jgi:hypothetical protein
MVVSPAHQSLNPGFDTCVSHKGEIFIQWKRRLSFPEVLVGVGCACIHRYKCMRVYVNLAFVLCFKKKI